MGVLDYTYKMVLKILSKEKSFSTIINKFVTFNYVNSNEIAPIKDSLKAFVNRYYYLKWEIKKLIPTDDEELLNILVTSLATLRYARKENIKREDVLKELEVLLKNSNKEVDIENIKKQLLFLADNVTRLNEEENKSLVTRISLTNSYPEWVVQLFVKHFSPKLAIRSIQASRKSAPISISINKLLVNSPLEDEEFVKTESCSTSYSFVGKGKLYENKLFMERKIFIEDQSRQVFYDKLDLHDGDKVLLVGQVDTSSVLSVGTRLGPLSQISASFENEEDFVSANKIVKSFKNIKADMFKDETRMLITHVEKGFDHVILMPKSSELGNIRKKPDVLLTLKQADLDNLINKQKEDLLEASSFVSEDGELDYLVPTLDKKESHMVIRDFLSTHYDFDLIEEDVIFPFTYMSEGLYYARLKKNKLDE